MRLRDHHGKNLADIFRFTAGIAGCGRAMDEPLLDRFASNGFLSDRLHFPRNTANAVSFQIRTWVRIAMTPEEAPQSPRYIVKVGARD